MSTIRPMRRLTSNLSRGLLSDSICYRCEASIRQSLLPTTSIFTNQKRSITVVWGNEKHPKGYRQKVLRKSKRQRDLDAQNKGMESGAPQLNLDDLKSVYSSDLFVFRCDISAGNILQAMNTLENFIELEILTADDIKSLAKAIQHKYRKTRSVEQTIPQARLLISHLKSGKIPGNPMTYVHLIGLFKEAEDFDQANNLWSWLKRQGEEHTDARVYGAIIECMAYQGTPLSVLEEVYQEALEKFSKVEDEGGGFHHRAIRLTLLQGIMTARILNGDWKGTYEILDIAGRLHPTSAPVRMYELLMYKASPKEAYMVFMMACRAGTLVPPAAVTKLMTVWWATTKNMPGLLNIINSYVGAGGKGALEHLNHMVFGLLNYLPLAPTQLPNQSEEEWQESVQSFVTLVNPVFDLVRRTISIFQLMGTEPNITTYNCIISQASKRNLRDIVRAAMSEIKARNFELPASSYSILLNAYGDFNDVESIKATWNKLVEIRLAEAFQLKQEKLRRQAEQKKQDRKAGKELSWKRTEDMEDDTFVIPWHITDWKAMIRACFRTNQKEFILQQLNTFDKQFEYNLIREIRKDLVECEARYQVDPSTIRTGYIPRENYEKFREEFQEYIKSLDLLETIIKSPVRHDFTTTTFNLDVLELPELDEQSLEDMKKVYEGFLSESGTENPLFTRNHDPKSTVKSIMEDSDTKATTGYTIGQLRFENWMTVNRLLFLNETFDAVKYRREKSGFMDAKFHREERAVARINWAKGTNKDVMEAEKKDVEQKTADQVQSHSEPTTTTVGEVKSIPAEALDVKTETGGIPVMA